MAGRTALVKATLSAIPVHMAIAFASSCHRGPSRSLISYVEHSCGLERTPSPSREGNVKWLWLTVCRPRELDRGPRGHGSAASGCRASGTVAMEEERGPVVSAPGRSSLPDDRAGRGCPSPCFRPRPWQTSVTYGSSTLFWTDNWMLNRCWLACPCHLSNIYMTDN